MLFSHSGNDAKHNHRINGECFFYVQIMNMFLTDVMYQFSLNSVDLSGKLHIHTRPINLSRKCTQSTIFIAYDGRLSMQCTNSTLP